MRNTDEFEMPSRVGQEAIAEKLIIARMKAESALVNYHESQSRTALDELQKSVNRLHRLTRTKWSGTDEIKPPTFLFTEADEDGDKDMKSFLDDLSADEMQKYLDRVGRLFEKLNLHGYMKQRSGDIGLGGQSTADEIGQKLQDEDR